MECWDHSQCRPSFSSCCARELLCLLPPPNLWGSHLGRSPAPEFCVTVGGATLKLTSLSAVGIMCVPQSGIWDHMSMVTLKDHRANQHPEEHSDQSWTADPESLNWQWWIDNHGSPGQVRVQKLRSGRRKVWLEGAPWKGISSQDSAVHQPISPQIEGHRSPWGRPLTSVQLCCPSSPFSSSKAVATYQGCWLRVALNGHRCQQSQAQTPSPWTERPPAYHSQQNLCMCKLVNVPSQLVFKVHLLKSEECRLKHR